MKKLKYIWIILLSFNLFAFEEKFDFTSEQNKLWSSYGEGIVGLDNQVGRGDKKGSLWLSNDFGESVTAFYQWDNLQPGTYQISFFVKMKDVQKGVDDVSLWHFYDGGEGTKSPFTNWVGTTGFRKVDYTLNVIGKNLTIWFRLKSPGEVWIDDFSIKRVNQAITGVKIEDDKTKDVTKALVAPSIKAKIPKKSMLFSFDQKEAGHEFIIKNGSGIFNPHKYYNFDITKFKIKQWGEYDRLEMDVFNPNSEVADFYLTLGDNLSNNYWTQLNHKQLLAPGWNKLSFSLDQYLGERGSHRVYRGLNLNQLKKAFIVIDQDQKRKFSKNEFLIDNISLSANPYPEADQGIKVFNFTSHKQKKLSGQIENVTSKTFYSSDRSFGFVNPKFWRIEDSAYTSELNRYTIGLLEGAFRVDLPNGKYKYQLNIDKLGYWDVPFWSDRYVAINGNPVLLEKRDKAQDFLNDFLQFEKILPKITDHPYHLYRNKIFREIRGEFVVSNGAAHFDFKGDATAIALNSLVVWKSDNQAKADQFISALDNRQKLEFDWMSRSLNASNTSKKETFLEIIAPTMFLTPEKKILNGLKKTEVLLGKNEKKVIFFQANLNETKKVNIEIADFKNKDGLKLNFDKFVLYEVLNQFNSYDINHESYLLSGKVLSPVKNVLTFQKDEIKYFALEVIPNTKTSSGLYKGEISIDKMKVELSIDLRNFSLKPIDFPVGFIGLDPLPFSYFKDASFNKTIRSNYRLKALEKILTDGFTTFTGLPEELDELDKIFSITQKYNVKTVFTYGGQFPERYVSLNNKKANQTESDFYRSSSNELKKILSNKKWPKIVYTFSDEASGYSDKVQEDLAKAKILKTNYPFLAIGGFGSFHSKEGSALNLSFDYGLYSSLERSSVQSLKKSGQNWGLYNAAAGSFDDPRFTFGAGLYLSRNTGLSHYLEWNSSSFNNYPYYDFDGREADITNFYPTSNGEINPSLKYILAAEGLNTYRKLKALEEVVLDGGRDKLALESKKWLEQKLREYNFYSSPTPMTNRDFNPQRFEQELDTRLKLHFK